MATGSRSRRFGEGGGPATGQHANMVWIVGSSAVFVVVGLILIATGV